MSSETTRQEVLFRLKKAAPEPAFQRVTPFPEPKKEAVVELFCTHLAMQGFSLHRSKDEEGFFSQLSEVVAAEKITKVAVAEKKGGDKKAFQAWAEAKGVELRMAWADGLKAYRDDLFSWADAGFTHVDGAAAETGSLLLSHGPLQPRMVSLAPEIHLAVVDASDISMAPSEALKKAMAPGEKPSQVTFISGPSLTADIRATPFYGMHGPRKVFVFLREQTAAVAEKQGENHG